MEDGCSPASVLQLRKLKSKDVEGLPRTPLLQKHKDWNFGVPAPILLPTPACAFQKRSNHHVFVPSPYLPGPNKEILEDANVVFTYKMDNLLGVTKRALPQSFFLS